MPPSPSSPGFPAPPVGPTAGFTPSQPISVQDSQSQPDAPNYENVLLTLDDLVDYEPGPTSTALTVVPDSQQETTRSDSPTTSSHLGGNSQDVAMADDRSFVVPDDAPLIVNSQATAEASSLSQELLALAPREPRDASPVARDLNRPPPGKYAEDDDDDPDYEDEPGDGDEDDDEILASPSAPPSVTRPSSPAASNAAAPAAATPTAAAATAAAPTAANPAPPAAAPAPTTAAPARHPDGTTLAKSYYRTSNPGHPVADGLAIRDAASSYGIPTGCCRYQLPNWWKPGTPAHVRWAKRAFDDALTLRFASSPLPREFTVHVHINDNESRQKSVDVYTAHSALHLALAAESLVLAGNDAFPQAILAPPRTGLAISPRYVPARVVFTQPIKTKEAQAALHHTLSLAPGVFVVEAWSIHEVNKGIDVFMEELVVLLFVPPPPPDPRPAWAGIYTGMSEPLTEKQKEAIPGFIGEGIGNILGYRARLDWCWGCKGKADHFHTTDRCVNTRVNCGLCHKRDHTGISCPRKTSVDAALLFAGPAPVPAPAPTFFPQAPSVPGFAPAPLQLPSGPAAPAAAAPPATAPPQGAFSFYAQFTQTPSGSAGPGTITTTPGASAPTTSAPHPSASGLAPTTRGSKRPSSASSVAESPSLAGPSSSAAADSSSSTARPLKGKGKTRAKPAAANPRPKASSSKNAPSRPDGFIQSSLNFSPASSSSVSTAGPSTSAHFSKRTRRAT
ncbi:hypothetical protein CF319_g4704 [Tilletia indica]|nr:hypothetical protein CF319_g4704 [Tilletia indica]